jgi:hypothetical protein
LGQTLNQGVNARAGGRQFGLEQVALVRQGQHLLMQQCIGLMQLFVAEQKVLNPVCNLVDGGGIRHVSGIVMSLIVGLVQVPILQWHLLVLGVWFTNPSSTGSRSVIPHGVKVTCAAPATVSRRAFLPRFHRLPLSVLKQALGKVMKVALLSPDTGQQGGFSREEPNVRALSGKAVRTHLLVES